MKTKTLTQSLSWLHTWAGLFFGWVLFAIFLTGTLAVFDKELNAWMQPELPDHSLSQSEAAGVAQAWLQKHHSDADSWNIGLPNERSPALTVSIGEQRRGGGIHLNPLTGEQIEPRQTAGGSFFFRFHYTLHMGRPLGVWLVGLAAMAMLVLIVSGIIIHKKFFKEFFTFRPAKGQRSWLDAHNASAVLFLPFHLMITYTGLVIFYLLYMPAAYQALFDGDRDAFNRALRSDTVMTTAAQPGNPASQRLNNPALHNGNTDGQRGRRASNSTTHIAAAELTPLGNIIEQAEQQLGSVGGLRIENPGKVSARIIARASLAGRIELSKGHSMTFDGVTGKVITPPPVSGSALLTQRVMAGLHFAQFGGYSMRWLYFIAGLISSAMIATGLVLFTVKRRKRPEAEGHLAARIYRLAEPINIAAVAGLCIACIGLLWANRMIPADLITRTEWEIRTFFGLWLLTLLHALLRPHQQAWREQFALAALLCIALPVSNWLTNVAGQYDWLQISIAGLGLCLAVISFKTGRITKKNAAKPHRAANSSTAAGV